MDSEKILKNLSKIEKEVKEHPPDMWVRFSIFKKQLDKNSIPATAETTPKKVILYVNVATGDVQFDIGGEQWCELRKWNSTIIAHAQTSPAKDYIHISHWTVEELYNIVDTEFTGLPPWNTKYKAKHVFSLVINNNKDFILRPTTNIFNSKSGIWEIAKTPIITRNNADFDALKNVRQWDTFTEQTINIKKCFAEVFGIGLIGGNKYIMFDDVSSYTKFLTYKDPVVRETPKQKLVDELVSIPLKSPAITFDSSLKSKLVCVASKVNEEYSVLRWFMETNTKEAYEISRLYITKKTQIFCRKDNSGKYLVLNNKLVASAFDSQQVIIQDSDAFTGTKLEYFTEIYKDLKPELRGAALYMLTVFPEFERMYKAGMENICIEYLSQAYGTAWTTYLTTEFGKINTKEKSINKMIGFNKYQINKLNSNRKTKIRGWYYVGLGNEIKNIVNMDDCSSLDNKAFDAILDILIYYPDDHFIVHALRNTVTTYSLKMCINMIPTLKKLGGVSSTAEMTNRWGITYTSTMSVMQIYTDYVNIVGYLGEASRMRPHFNSFEDIRRMHDTAVVTLNLKKDAIELDKFISRIDIWKKWEFDDDEKYEVIAPTKPEDIASEGITLHHCVKSYIGKVTRGATNILFIREKSKKDVPFFTVEVGNKGTIEQVHGFGNRNVDTEPGLDTFVKKWSKERRLKASSYNKVR